MTKLPYLWVYCPNSVFSTSILKVIGERRPDEDTTHYAHLTVIKVYGLGGRCYLRLFFFFKSFLRTTSAATNFTNAVAKLKIVVRST